ncbi:BREX-2 system phosphatase PglZ [Cellulomonas fimi]|uniref:BREX-2 system phosphatase PglZ n=1 Tax=Cellulomonas fimi TaxID=1708 RepID=A0A7Y0LXV7_CELFI|nr:BREX-2 system phosphatase PglZ [Cellulomonas fimi]NMR20262.1 BREX-2 system phosphatase PglZ [Cellulomonas fimi]
MTDRVPQASVALVTERAKKLVADGGAKVLVLRARPRWTGPPEITVGTARVLVRPAVSQLAALDAISERKPDDFLVLLSDRTEQEIGDAVLVRAERHRVELLDEWSAIPGLFGARALDPALRAAGRWVPVALLEHQPPEGWPQVSSGVVGADHALGNLLGVLLRRPLPVELDLVALLAALEVPAGRASWTQAPDPLRSGLTTWAGKAFGRAAAMALAAAARGPVSVVAIGLALDVLWPEASSAVVGPEQGPARGRIESRIDDKPVSPTAARELARAARTLLVRMDATDSTAVPSVLAQAEALLGDVGWSAGAEWSSVLPAGLRARFRALAEALTAPNVAALTADLPRIEGRLTEIVQHERAGARDSAVVAARMVVRLVRWLAAQPDRDQPADLGAALRRYADDGAWVDRAAAAVWNGSSDELVGTAYRSVLDHVHLARGTQDRDAAALLADATARDESPDGVALIESVLGDVVWPVASALRPLVILLDGMSAPVAVELAEAITTEAVRVAGWRELVPEGSGRRLPVLAALPTLTRYSRTAFFTGALREGNQSTEKQAVRARFGAPLFHKDDLRAPAGEVLPASVRSVIDDPELRMVAVVLNTIDDALDKQDPGGTRWGVDDVQHLHALLDAAALAGRAVVLTSDHGHVVERGSEARPTPGADARWRPTSSGPPTAGEVVVRGRRVVPGEVVLPWREDLRYASLRSGYHGGASLAEITVPFLLLSRSGGPAPRGWREAVPQAPAWWNEAQRVESTGGRRARRTAQAGGSVIDLAYAGASTAPPPTRADEGPQGVLDFAVPNPEAQSGTGPTGTGHGLIGRLAESEIYASQRRRAGRHPLKHDQVDSALTVLLDRGGRAHRDTVAAALGVSAGSFGVALAALTRLLNVEGYAVVSMDADGETVRLDERLLREQFELGAGRG